MRMSTERDILKSLLLKEELELLDTIKKKFLGEEQFTKEVSEVLAIALKRAQKKDKSIDRVLAKPIKEGVKRVFSDSKQSIVDALLPIMGQLIRKASTKALKWRWQAYKADIPFAQMVFQKTIRYQVKELFLISRENGLLIEHAGSEDLLKDKNAISGMLTAIQDFVGDSLNEPEADLLSIEIENKQILIFTASKAYLASVVIGSPTGRLKQKLEELIENIHVEFSEVLTDDNQYGKLSDVNDFLRANLITKSFSPESKNINWLPWVVLLLLALFSFSYWAYQKNQRYVAIVNAAKSIEGFSLQKVHEQGSTYQVVGLLDPIADISALQKDNIKLLTKSYVSLDAGIVAKRIEKIIAKIPSVKAQIKSGTVILSGTIAANELPMLLQHVSQLIGVEKVDNRLIINQKEEINDLLGHYPMFNQQSHYLPKQNILQLSGEATTKQIQAFRSKFQQRFPNIQLQEAVDILDSKESLIQAINTENINIEDVNNFKDLKISLNKLINNVLALSSRGTKLSLTIIGTSDCYGDKSDAFSLLRAQTTKDILIAAGIDEKSLSTTVIKCNQYQLKNQPVKLRVMFKAEEQK